MNRSFSGTHSWMSPIAPEALRHALGQFATGVTVVTTRAADGTPAGLTVNSFNSVSLNPALVLWSLARSSQVLGIFEQCEHFNVHVLSTAQIDLSNRFASPLPDRFAGVPLQPGISNAPLLAGCLARFQCRCVAIHEGGDHLILIGEVLACDLKPGEPLVYQGGHYRDLVPLQVQAAAQAYPASAEREAYFWGEGK